MSTDYLTVSAAHDGRICAMALSGELDMNNAALVPERAAQAINGQIERFVLDLSGLTFSDCAGARALAAAVGMMPSGCPVIIRSMHPELRRLLDLLGLDLQQPGAAPGTPPEFRTPGLVRRSQAARSQSRDAITQARNTARTVAATEDQVAAVLTQMAEGRPRDADRLTALSQKARTQAANCRSVARDRPARLRLISPGA